MKPIDVLVGASLGITVQEPVRFRHRKRASVVVGPQPPLLVLTRVPEKLFQRKVAKKQSRKEILEKRVPEIFSPQRHEVHKEMKPIDVWCARPREIFKAEHARRSQRFHK